MSVTVLRRGLNFSPLTSWTNSANGFSSGSHCWSINAFWSRSCSSFLYNSNSHSFILIRSSSYCGSGSSYSWAWSTCKTSFGFDLIDLKEIK